jgi:hypothetical protein
MCGHRFSVEWHMTGDLASLNDERCRRPDSVISGSRCAGVADWVKSRSLPVFVVTHNADVADGWSRDDALLRLVNDGVERV